VGFRISTLGVIPLLLLAFLQAPFAHVHEHESTQRHAGAFFHTHFAHIRVDHPVHHPELKDLDPDDDAIFQHWFSATQNAPQALNIILRVVPFLPPPVQSEWRAETVRPSAHDPPAIVLLPPRSPPA
jgi:hypothetical protein